MSEQTAPWSKGKMIVTAVDKDDIPIPNATVAISNTKGKVLHTLTTDAFGKTKEVDVPAPQRDYALDRPGMDPFSLYEVTVHHPDYVSKKSIGEHVFEANTAIPTVQMTEKGTRSSAGVFFEVKYIEKFNAWKSETKVSQDPLSLPDYFVPQAPAEAGADLSPSELFVEAANEESSTPKSFSLPPVSLTIPATVRVHMGAVNDNSAPNVDIPFIDYITGVLHQEISGFQEDQAIKANVVAAVSFTLNRIYTNFYGLKGKNYQITTDTSIDHAFKKKGTYTPQEKIVRYIGECFNEYVNYPDVQSSKFQPFLSQYCAGKPKKSKATCANDPSKKWMEQHGSEYLAKVEKKNYLEILEFYFGHLGPIFTSQSTWFVANGNVQPIIREIKKGDSGSTVLLMQQYMEKLGGLWGIPAIAEGIQERGRFGEKTEKAVKAFQKYHMKLPAGEVTGIIDKKTWLRLTLQYYQAEKILRPGESESMTASR